MLIHWLNDVPEGVPTAFLSNGSTGFMSASVRQSLEKYSRNTICSLIRLRVFFVKNRPIPVCPFCLFVFLSACLSICMSFCLYVFLSVFQNRNKFQYFVVRTFHARCSLHTDVSGLCRQHMTLRAMLCLVVQRERELSFPVGHLLAHLCFEQASMQQ